jgi:hypothetical protein
MKNNFGQFYQDFIQNSLMPKEREDYNKALKTFKLTQENFLELIEDIIDKHFIEVEGEIIPDLENLGQSKLIKTLGHYDNTKVKKEQEALKNLNYHLLSLFTIIKNYNYKAGLVNKEYNRKTENANKVLFERFAHLNNPLTNDRDFKGQQSFTLKNNLKTDKFIHILNSLKNKGFISRNTPIENFENIFLGVLISKENKIDWIGTNHQLKLFILGLKPKLRIDNKIYDTTRRCFTVNGKEIIKNEEISKSNISKGKSSNSQILEDIVSLF